MLALDLASFDQLVEDRGLDGLHDLVGGQGEAAESLLGGVALLPEFLDQFEDRGDAFVDAELHRVEEILFADLGRADLDHVDAVLVPGEHEVEIAEVDLGLGGVQDELGAVIGVDACDSYGGDGALEGGVRDVQCG